MATRTAKRPSSTSLSERLRPPQAPRLAKKFVALSLFWRTFFLLALLLASGVFAWVQTFRALEFEPFDRSLDVQISRLRKMIEPDPTQPRYIQTVWGVGYVFVPDGAA